MSYLKDIYDSQKNINCALTEIKASSKCLDKLENISQHSSDISKLGNMSDNIKDIAFNIRALREFQHHRHLIYLLDMIEQDLGNPANMNIHNKRYAEYFKSYADQISVDKDFQQIFSDPTSSKVNIKALRTKIRDSAR
jgi:hypothetical protein